MSTATKIQSVLRAAIGVFLASSAALGEPGVGETIVPPVDADSVAVNPVAGQVLQNTIFAQEIPVDNPNIGNQDMSDKYGQAGAAGSAQGAKVAAIVMGTSLTATGAVMAASIDPIIHAAGLDLLAKGATEFAQAGADAGAEQENRNLEAGRLRFETAQGQAQGGDAKERTAADIADRIRTPELESMLSKNGVNVDDFIDQMSRGAFQSPEEMAKAVGSSIELSGDDFAKGARLAEEKLASLAPAEEDALPQGGSVGTTIAGAINPGTVGVVFDQPTFGKNRGAHGQGAGLPAAAADGSSQGTSSLASLFGAAKEPQGIDALSAEELRELGVQRLRKGEHIFHKARRAFTSFGRWKKGRRVASHP